MRDVWLCATSRPMEEELHRWDVDEHQPLSTIDMDHLGYSKSQINKRKRGLLPKAPQDASVGRFRCKLKVQHIVGKHLAIPSNSTQCRR